ncbi:ligase-associated DNA damage response exonuclease [Sphingobium nicotianae]|uniref:Ligase-associated DNA damage response exonuclease n=1 Tax=Sphingobium nicotianae TaxID=2782607 RepID=A0A9X1DF23_9SPHN|nr:ligase-associated DNA damage response exonuclease [Sphingobium nicotianae]MBT2189010.1 ligase-associated DNA damage response exonuclease [Sphingobium nicotianae]
MSNGLGWLRAEKQGIYLPEVDCWIDPSIPVGKALVTHGHADHARGGHGHVMATAPTLAIMALRYGEQSSPRPVDYGDTVSLGDGITATFLPAGHVLGSAQILLERAGERVIVTGDYKRRPDPTCAPFEPTPCDILITEATFGLPVFVHPPIALELDKLVGALVERQDRCVLVGAYALGKAQRIIAELRARGFSDTIYLHGAMEKMCALYEAHGVPLGPLALVADTPLDDLRGKIVICPPSALGDRWTRRLPDPLQAFASGWMRVRQRGVQRAIELPLVISDHADWEELTSTIVELAPQETWITHGREDALVHWCGLHQIRARALDLVGYDDEDEN